MASSVFGQILLKHLWCTDELRAIFCDEKELRAALDPTTYVGLAPKIVDDVLAQVKANGWLN